MNIKSKIKFIIIISLFISFITHMSSVDASASTKNDIRLFKNKKLEKKNNKIVYRKFLNTSVPYIGADKVHSLSVTGKGTHVVVIDSGINATHPMVANKIALQACFTVNSSCPNSTNKQIGGNAANQVDWHGTHVAGIAAGKSSTLIGVAPDASIIPINVFDKDDSSSEASLINSLKWVLSISSNYNIAAINMSLGTSRIFRGYCDNVSPTLTSLIHQLYNKNIPVVVAAGNSYSLGMSHPACISKVVSVAALGLDGRITSFSNLSENTTFAAPGYKIISSADYQDYRQASGTSMSAPHVSGIFALYKQKFPNHSIATAVANLVSISPKAIDPYSRLSIPSINVSSLFSSVDNPTVTTTTIPSSPPSTLPVHLPPETPSIPSLPPLPSFKPYLTKIYTPTLQSSFFYIRYQDTFAPKNSIIKYVLDCSIKQYDIPYEPFVTNHVYKVSFKPDFSSCSMYAIMTDGTKSAVSSSIFLSRG